jgi:hypothetical protein
MAMAAPLITSTKKTDHYDITEIMLKMKTRQKNPDILRTKKVEKNCNFPSHFSKVYLKKQTKYQIVSGETRAAKDHVNFGVLPFLLHNLCKPMLPLVQ